MFGNISERLTCSLSKTANCGTKSVWSHSYAAAGAPPTQGIGLNGSACNHGYYTECEITSSTLELERTCSAQKNNRGRLNERHTMNANTRTHTRTTERNVREELRLRRKQQQNKR
ncbi:hypothetical protein QTP88_012226 [Uroleucon formosanum]